MSSPGLYLSLSKFNFCAGTELIIYFSYVEAIGLTDILPLVSYFT